jgi:16S rRNA (adenine1518-N6/adenine1519-N6)-dimethyltransferase
VSGAAPLNHDSPAELRATLATLGMRLQKRWGQNFLINRGAREKLVELLQIGEGHRVWEIGPGLGSMTELLLQVPGIGGLTVFEIDRGAIAWLQSRHGAAGGFRIVDGDALVTWKAEAARSGVPDRLLGNLPYASASAIIASLIEKGGVPPRSVFTVQKELADRMTAGPGDKGYSSFSILCRGSCVIERHGDLRPGSFYPPPEVMSTIVSLTPLAGAAAAADPGLMRALVRGLFSSRRKTLRASLAAGRGPRGFTLAQALDACAESGVDAARRPEQYDVADWIRLADALVRRRGAPAVPEAPAAGDGGPREP